MMIFVSDSSSIVEAILQNDRSINMADSGKIKRNAGVLSVDALLREKRNRATKILRNKSNVFDIVVESA